MKSRIQPKELVNSPAFSQAIEVSHPHSTIYIGGQNAVDSEGQIVGKDDFFKQSIQALSNLKVILNEANCSIEDVVKWTIYIAGDNEPYLGFKAFQEVFGLPILPPTITVLSVYGLSNKDYLVEVDAIAVK